MGTPTKVGYASTATCFKVLEAVTDERMLWRPKMMICLRTVPSSAALIVCAGPALYGDGEQQSLPESP